MLPGPTALRFTARARSYTSRTVAFVLEIGLRLEALEKPKAKERSGARTDRPDGKLPSGSAGATRDKVASALGISGKTYEKAKHVAYVLSKQNRRDLTPSQRAMIGARATALREKLEGAAKERQREAGGDRKSAKAKSVQEPVPEPIAREQSRDAIGKLVGVSGRTISDATKVIEKGIPELASLLSRLLRGWLLRRLLRRAPAGRRLERFHIRDPQ